MQRGTRLLAALLALAALPACGGSGTERFEDPSSIEVDSGQDFEILLDSNPTTGYEWRLAAEPDPALVEYVGSEYEPDEDSENRDGGGGTQTLTFEAQEAGSGTIALEYVFSGGEEETATKREIALTVR